MCNHYHWIAQIFAWIKQSITKTFDIFLRDSLIARTKRFLELRGNQSRKSPEQFLVAFFWRRSMEPNLALICRTGKCLNWHENEKVFLFEVMIKPKKGRLFFVKCWQNWICQEMFCQSGLWLMYNNDPNKFIKLQVKSGHFYLPIVPEQGVVLKTKYLSPINTFTVSKRYFTTLELGKKKTIFVRLDIKFCPAMTYSD